MVLWNNPGFWRKHWCWVKKPCRNVLSDDVTSLIGSIDLVLRVIHNSGFIIQGNSGKCTGAFKFGCRVIFYLSKSCRKSGLISHLSIEFTQKRNHIFKNFITNINICKFHTSKYFRLIFISIILNVHNDPCFEDKS